jgi:glycosyltransferase involved in cell wall biosynthesis
VRRSPRVLHLVISLAHGGLERLVVDWTNERNRQYPDSTGVCCLDQPGDLASQVETVQVMSLGACRSRRPFDVAAVWRLRQFLRARQIDVLHSHNAAAWQYGVLACFGTGVRHIHTEHGTNPHSEGWVNRLRNACLWRMTDVVVVVVEQVAEQVMRLQRIPRSRLCVISNGVATSEEREAGSPERRARGAEIRKRMGIEQDVIVIGSVGRLAKVKGYDRLIAAFARLTSFPATSASRLLLVGDGPERESLETIARKFGVAERVTFAGYQSDPRPYYDLMDLFILSSHSEGLSISLLEAMAAGVPVAVTDVGSCRQVVDDGRAGVVLPDDEGRWPQILARTLNDPEASQMRIAAARARVREHYSLDATLDGYERLYSAE